MACRRYLAGGGANIPLGSRSDGAMAGTAFRPFHPCPLCMGGTPQAWVVLGNPRCQQASELGADQRPLGGDRLCAGEHGIALAAVLARTGLQPSHLPGMEPQPGLAAGQFRFRGRIAGGCIKDGSPLVLHAQAGLECGQSIPPQAVPLAQPRWGRTPLPDAPADRSSRRPPGDVERTTGLVIGHGTRAGPLDSGCW